MVLEGYSRRTDIPAKIEAELVKRTSAGGSGLLIASADRLAENFCLGGSSLVGERCPSGLHFEA